MSSFECKHRRERAGIFVSRTQRICGAANDSETLTFQPRPPEPRTDARDSFLYYPFPREPHTPGSTVLRLPEKYISFFRLLHSPAKKKAKSIAKYSIKKIDFIDIINKIERFEEFHEMKKTKKFSTFNVRIY